LLNDFPAPPVLHGTMSLQITGHETLQAVTGQSHSKR